MALAFYFSPPNLMSAAKYDECTARLKAAGQQHPRGRQYHSCFGTADSVAVFDVWGSQAEFDEFGKTLMPILQAIGVDPGAPMVMPVHNVIVPSAPRPKKAVKKAAPKKAAKKVVKKVAKKVAAKRAPVKKAAKAVKKAAKGRGGKKR